MLSLPKIIEDKNELNFEKCGDIFVSVKNNLCAINCIFCSDIFMQLPEFLRHLQIYHNDDLDFGNEPAEVYSVEELLGLDISKESVGNQFENMTNEIKDKKYTEEKAYDKGNGVARKPLEPMSVVKAVDDVEHVTLIGSCTSSRRNYEVLNNKINNALEDNGDSTEQAQLAMADKDACDADNDNPDLFALMDEFDISEIEILDAENPEQAIDDGCAIIKVVPNAETKPKQLRSETSQPMKLLNNWNTMKVQSLSGELENCALADEVKAVIMAEADTLEYKICDDADDIAEMLNAEGLDVDEFCQELTKIDVAEIAKSDIKQMQTLHEVQLTKAVKAVQPKKRSNVQNKENVTILNHLIPNRFSGAIKNRPVLKTSSLLNNINNNFGTQIVSLNKTMKLSSTFTHNKKLKDANKQPETNAYKQKYEQVHRTHISQKGKLAEKPIKSVFGQGFNAPVDKQLRSTQAPNNNEDDNKENKMSEASKEFQARPNKRDVLIVPSSEAHNNETNLQCVTKMEHIDVLPPLTTETTITATFCKVNFTESVISAEDKNPKSNSTDMQKRFQRQRAPSIDVLNVQLKTPKPKATNKCDYKSYAIHRTTNKKEVLRRMSNIKKRILKSLATDYKELKQQAEQVNINSVEILPNIVIDKKMLTKTPQLPIINENMPTANPWRSTNREEVPTTWLVSGALKSSSEKTSAARELTTNNTTAKLGKEATVVTNRERRIPPASIVKTEYRTPLNINGSNITKNSVSTNQLGRTYNTPKPFVKSRLTKVEDVQFKHLSGPKNCKNNNHSGVAIKRSHSPHATANATESQPVKQLKRETKAEMTPKAPEKAVATLNANNFDPPASTVEFLQSDSKSNIVLNILNDNTERDDVSLIVEGILSQERTESLSTLNIEEESPVSSAIREVSEEDITDDDELLKTVGLHVLMNVNYEDRLPLDVYEQIHERATRFASFLKDCDLIWHTKQNKAYSLQKDLQTEFTKLLQRTNAAFSSCLLLNELRRIVNLITIWYTKQCDSRLLEKKPIHKAYEFYFKLFGYMPKTMRRRFYCEFCEEHFNTENKYKLHRLVHTGTKSLSCAHCPKTFKRQWNLDKHAKNHI